MRAITRLAMTGAAAACGGAAALGTPPDVWAERARAAAGHAGASVEVIGHSVQGRELLAVRVRGPGGPSVQNRPTLAVIAGIDGRHVTGSRLAIALIDQTATERSAALSAADLVVVPCMNPDGMARFEGVRPREDAGDNAARRTTARDDADRDRRMDEDGPLDLDGDGLITQMRVKRPRAGLLRDLAATDVVEPDEPRLMRRADLAKGETGEYALLVEGKDQDGDGLIGEDGASGVDLDSNFPYHWPEFEGKAGPTPLCEPESRAMADWVLAHPEIVAVLVYGPNDNLVTVPVGGKMDPTGEIPISGGVLDDDRAEFESVAKVFKETTGISGVGGATRSFDGSLAGWAYAHAGIAAFMTPGWVRPDLVKPEHQETDAEKEAEKQKDAPGEQASAVPDSAPPQPEAMPKAVSPAPEADPKKPAPKKGLETEDAKWLTFSDAQTDANRGFVAWKPFEHPQLGAVEIGGWAPGFRLNGPGTDEMISQAAAAQAKFVDRVLAALPRLEVEPARVQAVGGRGGAWKIAVSAVNAGRMPTRTAMGVKSRRLPATRWEIQIDTARLLSGRRVQGAGAVAAGGSLAAEWVVAGDAGSEVRVKLLSPEMGDQEAVVKLENSAAAGEGGR